MTDIVRLLDHTTRRPEGRISEPGKVGLSRGGESRRWTPRTSTWTRATILTAGQSRESVISAHETCVEDTDGGELHVEPPCHIPVRNDVRRA